LSIILGVVAFHGLKYADILAVMRNPSLKRLSWFTMHIGLLIIAMGLGMSVVSVLVIRTPNRRGSFWKSYVKRSLYLGVGLLAIGAVAAFLS
jgi:preprotein translocase subunit Sss1